MTKITTIDGLPVFDVKKNLTLTVTKDDIRRTHTRAPNACAVARACSRQLHVKEARIHLGRIYLRTNEHNWQRYQTSLAMRREIIDFDRTGRFAEGTYTVASVGPANATGKQQGSKHPTTRAARKARSTGRKQKTHIWVTDVRGGPVVE